MGGRPLRGSWLALFFWAVVALLIWGLLVNGVGLQIQMPGIRINIKQVFQEMSASGRASTAWERFSGVILLATGARFSGPGLLAWVQVQAVGYSHYLMMLIVFLGVGWLVNRQFGHPKAAIRLALMHGLVISLFAVISGGVKIADASFFDVVWRYTLVGLTAGASLFIWQNRQQSGEALWELTQTILGILFRSLRSTRLPLSSPNQSPPFTPEEIAERNARQGATGGPHIYCRKCGQRLAIWAPGKFCDQCGHPIGLPDGGWICLACQARPAPGDRHCFKCGAEVVEARYCEECGWKLGSDHSPSRCHRAVRQSLNGAIICGSCRQLGIFQDPSSRYCIFCGELR